MYRIKCGIGRVDVLAVVFIVAMLVGVLLPALAKGRSESAAEVCESKLRKQWMGHLLWAEDHDGHFFDTWLWYRSMITYKNRKGYMTYDDIDCPASTSNPYGYWISGHDGASPPYVKGGYAFNGIMNTISWGSPNANRVAGHKNPSKAAVVVDSFSPYWNLDYSGTANNMMSYRHNNVTVNVVWLDGHVSNDGFDRVFTGRDLYYNWPNE